LTTEPLSQPNNMICGGENDLRIYADSSDASIENEEYLALRNRRSNGYGNSILRVSATSSRQKTRFAIGNSVTKVAADEVAEDD
jgi:hypothetical protein